MKTLRVSDEVYEAIRKLAKGFGAVPPTAFEDLDGVGGNGQTEVISVKGKARTEITELVNTPEYKVENAKGRYFQILRFICNQKQCDRTKLLLYRRGSRVNFARDPQTIQNSGNDTKPEKLPGTDLYILTNLSNRDKRVILEDVLTLYKYPESDVRQVVASIPDSGIQRPKRSVLPSPSVEAFKEKLAELKAKKGGTK